MNEKVEPYFAAAQATLVIACVKVEKGLSGWLWVVNFQSVDNNGDAT